MMEQTDFDFDGATYEPEHDKERLNTQLARVKRVMADGRWRTLSQIHHECGVGSEGGVAARLRDLRKERFGGLGVERRRVDGGLFEYRVMGL